MSYCQLVAEGPSKGFYSGQLFSDMEMVKPLLGVIMRTKDRH